MYDRYFSRLAFFRMRLAKGFFLLIFDAIWGHSDLPATVVLTFGQVSGMSSLFPDAISEGFLPTYF